MSISQSILQSFDLELGSLEENNIHFNGGFSAVFRLGRGLGDNYSSSGNRSISKDDCKNKKCEVHGNNCGNGQNSGRCNL
jgi:hypothetical protein